MRGGRGGSKRDCEGYGPAMDMKFGTQYGIHKESIHAKNQPYPILPWYLTTVCPLKIKEMNPTGYTWLEEPWDLACIITKHITLYNFSFINSGLI